MVNFEAMVFDMDGLLFDTETVSKKAWRQIGREMGIEDIAHTLENCVGLNPQSTRDYFAARYGADFPYDDFSARTSQVFYEILERDGLHLMPGVREILDYLKAQGKPIGLASSTRLEGVLHHLRDAGIEHYFDAIVTGDQVQNGKPHPEIYLTACARLGCDPKRCLAAEDSPNGVRAAHAAGMRAIMVPDQIAPTNAIRACAHVIRDSLLDVLDWLREDTPAEYWDAYDANGNAAGETLVRGEPIPKGLYHVVVDVSVRHADGDFLFMRRDLRKAGSPGLWECGAGGSVLAGETWEQGAWRELGEETGICTGPLKHLGTRVYEGAIFADYLLVTSGDKQAVVLQPGETIDFRWIARQEVQAFLGSDACIPAMHGRFERYAKELMG